MAGSITVYPAEGKAIVFNVKTRWVYNHRHTQCPRLMGSRNSQAVKASGESSMRRYLAITLTLVGVLVLIVAAVSWFLFPDWRKLPSGLLLLLVAALGGVLLALSGF